MMGIRKIKNFVIARSGAHQRRRGNLSYLKTNQHGLPRRSHCATSGFVRLLAMTKSQRGVSLTELSVSVFVITLMIAGTFGGVTMLKAAKIRKAATELTTYMAAINEFQQQYDYLPGDLPTASSFWSAAPAAHNGNGDGLIPYGTEDLYVWEHLGKSKLIAGTYTGLYADTPTNSIKYTAGINTAGSDAFTNVIFSFKYEGSPVYGIRGNALEFGSPRAGGATGGGVMVAKDAYSIDIKIDDGLAASGMLTTFRDVSGCTDANGNTATANYVLTDTTNTTCVLLYWHKKD